MNESSLPEMSFRGSTPRMKTHITLLGYSISIFLLIASCTSKTSPPLEPYKNNLGIKPAVVAQIDSAHYTTIKWINPVCTMGNVREGDSVLMKFWYENTGKHPLFISAVKPACGCTIPFFSDAALFPGERGFLSAYFNTHNQEGNINKTIVVTTNTSNSARHVLRFTGNVLLKK